MGFPDRIERTVELAHPPAKVWAALTTAEGLAAWFGNEAAIDLHPGGSAWMKWNEGHTARMRVEQGGGTEGVRGLPGTSPGCPTMTRAAPMSSSRSNRPAGAPG